MRWFCLIAFFITSLVCIHPVLAQSGLARFDKFEIKENDVVWKMSYRPENLAGDSLRYAIVRMVKSKFYTFNVVRNQIGYNGELKHFKVDAKKYGRTYLNTPRLYWEGEWTGKFTIDLKEDSYEVTIYALYYEKMERADGYYRTEKPVKGRFIDAVTTKSKTSFRKHELPNLSLMGKSLRDEFDVQQAK